MVQDARQHGGHAKAVGEYEEDCSSLLRIGILRDDSVIGTKLCCTSPAQPTGSGILEPSEAPIDLTEDGAATGANRQRQNGQCRRRCSLVLRLPFRRCPEAGEVRKGAPSRPILSAPSHEPHSRLHHQVLSAQTALRGVNFDVGNETLSHHKIVYELSVLGLRQKMVKVDTTRPEPERSEHEQKEGQYTVNVECMGGLGALAYEMER
ncbi:hypothetical protein PG996_009180 [Apiospora saccharicola]|uniref:Uncharacterized protein n=1 Tax=Apiospora saccharicola TaxID=335842 RepID=A0ABR1UK05_9PEZI